MGADRRQPVGGTPSGPERPRPATCQLLIGTVATAALVDVAWGGSGPLAAAISTWTAAACAGAGLTFVLLRRATGLARPAWLGSSLLVLAAEAAADAVVHLGVPRSQMLTAPVACAALVSIAYALMIRVAPDVDTRVTPARLLVFAALVVLVGTAVFASAARLDRSASLPDVLPTPPGFMWAAAAGATGLALVAGSQLGRAFNGLRSSALRATVEATEASQQSAAAGAAQAERDHVLRSTVFAIDSVLRAMDAVDDASRSQLRSGLAQQLDVARSLLAPQASDGTFDLCELVRAEVAVERTTGAIVDDDIPHSLHCSGSAAWTAEILRTLLDNARCYAPGAVVHVTVEAHDDRAVLRVRDEGPGVPDEQCLHLFDRGWRGRPDVEGNGLGLFIAAELARRQDGELLLEAGRPGASFLLRLPVAARIPADLGVRR